MFNFLARSMLLLDICALTFHEGLAETQKAAGQDPRSVHPVPMPQLPPSPNRKIRRSAPKPK